jgi:ABC-type polysaccharide/polyol phosphate transport system ATPase subunit
MSEFAINVENLSKRYRIGKGISQSNGRASILAKLADPFRYLFDTLREPSPDEIIWALKDISFEVRYGEVLGIVGRNGAGKSTLLKILSRITEPTSGRALVNGRVGSLLEVGTGFHPELTGRENIYLNGAILGMKRAEIERKFDEIVAFSEVEKFIDTPVKRYSSGMYVRLAFAVAAHLEPEILIVDEVLAVGDAEFQKKCLGKMGDVASEGRTILFVSHNMSAVRRLCPKSLLLDQGHMIACTETSDIIALYQPSDTRTALPKNWLDISKTIRNGTGEARFDAVLYSSHNEATNDRPYPNGPIEFLLRIYSDSFLRIKSLAVTFYDRTGNKLVNADTQTFGQVISLNKGEHIVRLEIKELHLNPGTYTLGLWLANPPFTIYDQVNSAFEIEVVNQKTESIDNRPLWDGSVTCSYDVKQIE